MVIWGTSSQFRRYSARAFLSLSGARLHWATRIDLGWIDGVLYVYVCMYVPTGALLALSWQPTHPPQIYYTPRTIIPRTAGMEYRICLGRGISRDTVIP